MNALSTDLAVLFFLYDEISKNVFKNTVDSLYLELARDQQICSR